MSGGFHVGDVVSGDKVGGNKYVKSIHYERVDATPGFEALAQVVVRLLAELDRSGLPGEERAGVRAAGEEVLEEVTKPEPDRTLVQRSLAAIKGFLAPVAMGLSTGAAAATQDWAKQAVEQLGTAF